MILNLYNLISWRILIYLLRKDGIIILKIPIILKINFMELIKLSNPEYLKIIRESERDKTVYQGKYL